MSGFAEIELTIQGLTNGGAARVMSENKTGYIPLSMFETPPDHEDINEIEIYEVQEWFLIQNEWI